MLNGSGLSHDDALSYFDASVTRAESYVIFIMAYR